MTRTWADISKRMLFVYCMLVGFIFLFLPTDLTGKLQGFYMDVFHVPLGIGHKLTVAARTTTRSQDPLAQENERLREENRLLENKYANIESQLQTAQQRIDELTSIRTTRPEWSRMSFLPAGVVTDPATGQNELIIARGQEDGVAKGQYVMAESSIIGTISVVFANTARVRLITDPKCSIPVQLGGSDVRRIMVGRGDGTAGITPVSKKESVKVDSTVLAQIPTVPGVSIVAAKVTKCEPSRKEPLVWDVSVKPACDVVNLKSVIVIVPRK
jgi:cell shape-determining protein MreC